jgi:hypothetical protein
MAVWAWFLEPQLAAVLAVFGGLTGQLLAVFTVRRAWHAKDVLPFLAGGIAGCPWACGCCPGWTCRCSRRSWVSCSSSSAR